LAFKSPKQIVQSLANVLSENTKNSYTVDKSIRFIAQWLQANPEQIENILKPILQGLGQAPKVTIARVFSLMTQINHPNAIKLFISFGLNSKEQNVVATAVLATHRSSFLSSTDVLRQLLVLAKGPSSIISNLANAAVKTIVRKTTGVGDSKSAPLANLKDSDFPYNVSWSDDIKLGGSEVGADFNVALFAGTNFDCNHPTFNYEASAIGTVNVNLFGFSTEAVDTGAIYGRVNGAPAQDEIYLKVFGDTIYDKQLPSIDCLSHQQDIAHASPGFSVSYVIWVSVIPITLSASASLDLDLSWDWKICPDQLTAEVEVVPKGTLTVGGDAEIDLLIIKAGIQLSGGFETSLPPQAALDGSLCQITFDVLRQSSPLVVNFDGYFAVKSCRYWIFDCHWKNEDTVNIFQWSLPAQNQVIFQKTWKIAAK